MLEGAERKCFKSPLITAVFEYDLAGMPYKVGSTMNDMTSEALDGTTTDCPFDHFHEVKSDNDHAPGVGIDVEDVCWVYDDLQNLT